MILERWRKLVWNIPFNGLSITAGGIDTAAILADPVLRRRVAELMAEVIQAAKACGYPLPESAADEQMKRTETMGAYKPSTLVDFLAGRPLEIDAIWEEPLRRANAAGIAAPHLAKLCESLRALERKPSSRPAPHHEIAPDQSFQSSLEARP